MLSIINSRWADSINSRKWAGSIRKCKVEEIALSPADSSSKARKSQITTDEKTKRDKEKNYEVTAFGSFRLLIYPRNSLRLLPSSFFLLPLFALSATAQTSQSDQASAITAIVQKAMKTEHLRAVIVKVTQGDEVVISQAFGESVTGVPATTAMHFPNGAVAFAYLGTLLMEFVDEHKVKLDDTIERWMPDLPEANKVTLKMLANQTPGYPDFETDPKWLAAWTADPFHIWTFEERIKYAFERPMQFEPGTNWSYAHTNFMILGEILAKIGNNPLDVLLREKVLTPMGLKNTG